MQITPATLGDLPQLVSLLTLLFSQEEDFHPDRKKQEEGLRLILEHPRTGIIFVAREGDVILGMVNLLFSISTAEGGKVLLLEDLVVLPQHRRQGLGQALLGEARAFGQREGYLRISLQTDLLNARAQALYTRFGYQASKMIIMRARLSED
jgi:GNAT superfamily N-acetyltransferase